MNCPTTSARFLALAILIPTLAVAQHEPQVARLTIAPTKKEYLLGEAVFVTYRLTNISGSLLCFPPPAVDCYSISGELAASAAPPKEWSSLGLVGAALLVAGGWEMLATI